MSKKYNNIYKGKLIFLLVFSLLIFGSCEDYLDFAPELEIGEDDVFKNFRSAQGYLDNCYMALASNYLIVESQGFVNVSPANLSDEAAFNASNQSSRILNTGDWFGRPGLPEVGYDNNGVGTKTGRAISNSFYTIRITNNIIEKVPAMNNITQEEKDQLIGQAYFYRSWSYFQIIKRWGGMQIFDKVYATDEFKDEARLSYQQSTEWLIEGFDKAFELLPEEWDEANTGRPVKIAALAAKSMAALYAASPLMQNLPGEPVKNNGYSSEWTETAIQYTYDALKYVWEKLPHRDMQGLSATTPEEKAEAYRHVFYHKLFVAPEHLWAHNSAGQNRDGGGNYGATDMARLFLNVNYSGRPGGFGQNFSSVSQNMVDMFELINPDDGLAYPFGDPALGTLDEQWQNPYHNRDPRFYNNVHYTGGAGHGTKADGSSWYLETYPGGADYMASEQGSVKTGYMCKKWWWPTFNKVAKGWTDYYFNAAFIRTTQLYLDYAELMNEAYGPNADPKGYGMTAVQAINKVRNRVGMVDVNPKFTASKELFRERIINERAVELMWEDHRFHDLRRWMIAHEVFATPNPIKGVKTTDLTPEISNVGEKTFRYEPFDITSEIRVFEMKHYWYPLPKDHMERLVNVKQNPGW